MLQEEQALEKRFLSSYDQIYAIVRQIPCGQVATYGQVAELANLPGQARLVGYALFRVPSDEIPWHRVINAKGEVSQSPWRWAATTCSDRCSNKKASSSAPAVK